MAKKELTIREILEDISEVVKNRQSQMKEPDWWLDRAFMLNGLLPELNDELIVAEMNYNREITSAIDDLDISVAKAERRVKGNSNTYRLYKYLKERKKTVEEMILLAKKKYKDNY